MRLTQISCNVILFLSRWPNVHQGSLASCSALNCELCNCDCRSSVREVVAFDPHSLSSPLYKIDLDTSPSILVPYYDADSSTLFLTGRVSCQNYFRRR